MIVLSLVTVDASEAIALLDRTIKGIQEGSRAAMQTIGDSMVQGAKEIVPVDTGRLQNSIRIMEITDESVTVGSDVEYAPDVEFGTFKQAAQPYLGPQLDRMQTEAPQIVADEISKRIR